MTLGNVEELKPYPEMKDSGVEWLGEVPVHWGVRRLRTLVRIKNGATPASGEPRFWDGQITWITPDDLGKLSGAYVGESGRQITTEGYNACGTTLAPSGSVALSIRAPIGHLGVLTSSACVNQGCRLLVPGDAVHSAFLYQALKTARTELTSLGQGTTFPELPAGRLADLRIALPPLLEQTAIVRFLDHADRPIRRYIRVKQKLIALLEEQKQAIIHRAVTGQIDVRTGQPYSAYKDSGAEWLGGVPEHWEVVALRRRWQVIDCKHLTVPFVDDGIPLASVREAQSFELDLTTSNRTTSEWYEELIEGGREPRLGDLIYCRNVSVGAAALVTTEIPFAMGQDVCLLRSSSENHRWLNYFLQSKVMSDQLALILVGSTFNRINVADIRALLIAVPPVAEQDRIAVVLDDELNQIDVAIDVCLREQALLLGYHTRLIADVVTGKLDVREAAAVMPEEDVYGDSEESAEEQESRKIWPHDGLGRETIRRRARD